MVMELARFLAARREQLTRDVLFVLFTGEELGLLGSKHYVSAPIVPLEQTVAMLNFDMVGRLERGTLQIGGTGTSPVFPTVLDEANRRLRIDTRYNPGGQAPSDNAPFYDEQVPVLFFFTGLHGDYHRCPRYRFRTTTLPFVTSHRHTHQDTHLPRRHKLS